MKITIEAKNAKEFKMKIAELIGESLEGQLQLANPDHWLDFAPTYFISGEAKERNPKAASSFVWKNCPKFKNGKYIVQ